MSLRIEATWERLPAATPEDRASSALLGIFYEKHCLTEAHDAFVGTTRQSVYLSAFRLAEWLAWNWWRLCHEPRAEHRADWAMAHRLSTIGGGYVWPDITVMSDGERAALVARPTRESPIEPLRYLSDIAIVVPVADLQRAITTFVERVCGRLSAEGMRETNLQRIWSDVIAERADPARVMTRRLEAALGFDPDEAPDRLVATLRADIGAAGLDAVLELAAARTDVDAAPTLTALRERAVRGHESRTADMVLLRDDADWRVAGSLPAWRGGTAAARRIRQQERLGDGPLTNLRLASLSSVSTAVLDTDGEGPLSFGLSDDPQTTRIVLRRAPRETSRRFELSRLLGDRLLNGNSAIFPATRTGTYRQKWQRAFAAELLCPFEALQAMLAGDHSQEALEDAADHYSVSPWMVHAILVNHGEIERSSLEDEASVA